MLFLVADNLRVPSAGICKGDPHFSIHLPATNPGPFGTYSFDFICDPRGFEIICHVSYRPFVQLLYASADLVVHLHQPSGQRIRLRGLR